MPRRIKGSIDGGSRGAHDHEALLGQNNSLHRHLDLRVSPKHPSTSQSLCLRRRMYLFSCAFIKAG